VKKDHPHRWAEWVSKHAKDVLKEYVNLLKKAWAEDKKDPRSFPLSTGELLFELERRLKQGPGTEGTQEWQPSRPSPPRRLSDLVDEKLVKIVFEQQNSDSYERALRLAAFGGKKRNLAWRKISLALNAAYLIKVDGPHAIPRPRVDYLHRELLKMTEQLKINKLTHAGIAEFLDDICPCCGIKHRPGTVRKLRNRWSRSRWASR